MGEIVLNVDSQNNPIQDSNTLLKAHLTEELVIGICGQLGTNLTLVTKNLQDIFTNSFGYECKVIKMSDYILHKYPSTDVSKASEYNRITQLMNLGNQLRKTYTNQILANLAIAEIGKDRYTSKTIKPSDFKSRRICYIINSIKHPAEYDILQKVYTKNFYLLSTFSTYDRRCKKLKELFIANEQKYIKDLTDRDTGEDLLSGQKVEDVFIKADYFIRMPEEENDLIKKLTKFIDLIFDFGINTPTIEENAMHQATAAAVNSACLSRQVGACITDSTGDILALGWNDVPTAGGGVYKTSSYSKDSRCYAKGICANSEHKDELIKTLTDKLFEKDLVKTFKKEEVQDVLKQYGIKNLIEFSRSIHAEMQAIIIGSQKTGNKMVGGKLFCTTYPCHNCARHIILAGIKEVYFIEPYKKSLCIELHSDAITEKEKEKDEDKDKDKDKEKVKILMYEGVAPKSFMKFYKQTVNDRKTEIGRQDKQKIKPKHMVSLEALHEKEIHCLETIKDHGFIDIGN